MRIALLVLLFLTLSLDALSQFESSKVCQKCHPIIYKEHSESSHRNASIYNDAIHKAIWDKHPAKAKDKYKCAVCHTPNDKKLIEALSHGEKAVPQENRAQLQEGVSCASCHNIKSIEKHATRNRNIITHDKKKLYSARASEKNVKNKEYEIKKDFFGLVTKESGSAFHNIDFTNEIYYNGNVCLGCHDHKQNAKGFDVCNMQQEKTPNSEKTNCITCHMPEVSGSFTTLRDSKTHKYHGFTGTMHKPKMLAKYVDISFEKVQNGFNIIIENKANHTLLLHPLRVGELKVELLHADKKRALKSVKFVRIIGKDKKPSPPWLANEIVKNTQIKAYEKRKIFFDTKVEKGDSVMVKLGHYIIMPKVAKKLGLENKKDLSTFKLLKEETFYVK